MRGQVVVQRRRKHSVTAIEEEYDYQSKDRRGGYLYKRANLVRDGQLEVGPQRGIGAGCVVDETYNAPCHFELLNRAGKKTKT